MQFELVKSEAMQEAKRLVNAGGGKVNSMEVAACIVELLEGRQDIPDLFIRKEKNRTVGYSLLEMSYCIQAHLECLPSQ